ncbi:MAG: methyltransferase domain-containing protein [Planctomycetaceae bacterium]|nr:methyltransferase domain-containing protein [Planctomycetales bacterium]MCB9920679.1 methyltransferase domain-containing protein [Planctomycetaceae bacterium]
MHENIDDCKRTVATDGRVKYRLKNATVYVSPTGYHFTDFLDDTDELNTEIDIDALDDETTRYIESSLQSNKERFDRQAKLADKYVDLNGAKALDVGCGGGKFLSLLARQGADVTGIELSDSRAQYCRQTHGFAVHKTPIENQQWQKQHRASFDLVTLWDVIEHVNFPQQTLTAAANLLRPGGWLMIDTPCRDSFYYRAGRATYALTGGRYPTFLNIMYSNHPFGHKQIFSTGELTRLFGQVELEHINAHKLHEHSFPLEFYLEKLIPSKLGVRVATPVVQCLSFLLRVKNKVIVVGQKKAASEKKVPSEYSPKRVA